MTIRIFVLLCWLPAQVFACDFAKVSFAADFPGGKLSRCEQISELHYKLTTVAENYPINPSPWYAFRVLSKAGTQNIRIDIDAVNGQARYLPKISDDGKNWRDIPFDVHDGQLQIALSAKPQPLYVAGQELLTQQDYLDWMASPPVNDRFTQIVIGSSVQGRDIVALAAKSANNNEWVLIIGRQHPPELTGALGLLAFVDQLAMTSELQKAFFGRFNILVVPMVNPDGVANGHWRHNAAGKDLNRDWGDFTQPETKAVVDYLNMQLGEEQRLVFALDFHSTQQDIFYTLLPAAAAMPTDIVNEWLASLKQHLVSSFTIRERAGYRVESNVFTHFIGREYGVHSVTYEFGDNTPRQLVRHVAQLSATELMKILLTTEPEAFIPQSLPGKPEQLD